MGFLRVLQIDGRITLVPDDEALALLQANDGDVFGVVRDADGRMTLSSPARSNEERVEAGKA
ncbi:hypothetical protein BH11PSE2_BH11PSE2_10730 [soil metagenome]